MVQILENEQDIEVGAQPSARNPHTDNIAAKMAAYIPLQEEPKKLKALAKDHDFEHIVNSVSSIIYVVYYLSVCTCTSMLIGVYYISSHMCVLVHG